MATIKVKDSLYSSAAYGNLDSDERALFWELLGMTRFGEMIRIEDAAFKLRRPADAKPCRTVKQSIQMLERAGLVRVEDGRLEVVSADAYAHSNAPNMAKTREKKKAMEAVSQQPATLTAPAQPAASPAPKKKRSTQVSKVSIPASVNFEIPAEFDPAAFQRFLEIRASNSRKKITQEMVDEWAAQIQALRANGVDLAKALRCAVSKSWQGFYPIPNGWIDPTAPVPQAPAALAVNLPDFVPADLFHHYLERRAAKLGRPNTQENVDFLINQLREFKLKNQDIQAIIKKAADGGPDGAFTQFSEIKRGAFHGTGAGNVNPNAARGRVVI